jgi:hydrogenase expression/formation protein HypC
MCLAIPGKILELQRSSTGLAARVEFGGIVRAVRLDFVPHAEVGDYVIVHVGFAISRVDAAEAQRTLETLKQAGVPEVKPL